jgi:transposase
MGGSKECRDWSAGQGFLLPPSPLEWLEEGHLAYFILDVVATLDLRKIRETIDSKDSRGTRPYSPRMMVALLLYGYCTGVYSSRRIERATYEDVPFRVLSGGDHPHFTRINAFRKTHLEALGGLFLQVLQLCQRANLVKLGHVALDGTKIEGDASKHKAMSHDRMTKDEQQLRTEIDELLTRAEVVDADEDARYGVGEKPEDLPAELRRRVDRLERIREAKAALEEEAREARAQALREQAERAEKRSEQCAKASDRKRAATLAAKKRAQAEALSPENEPEAAPRFETAEGLPKHRVPTMTTGEPTGKAQRNFTDPESRILKRGGSYLQGYNCQAAVDGDHQVIVAQAVTNQSPDNGNLGPMVELLEANCGASAEVITADAGYWNPDEVARAAKGGSDLFISTKCNRHGSASAGEEAEPDRYDTSLGQMQAKLSTPRGRAIYAKRKSIVEPVFGQIKECRGFRQFSLRGLAPVGGEWSLVCTCHNLLKLFRYGPTAVAVLS